MHLYSIVPCSFHLNKACSVLYVSPCELCKKHTYINDVSGRFNCVVLCSQPSCIAIHWKTLAFLHLLSLVLYWSFKHCLSSVTNCTVIANVKQLNMQQFSHCIYSCLADHSVRKQHMCLEVILFCFSKQFWLVVKHFRWLLWHFIIFLFTASFLRTNKFRLKDFSTCLQCKQNIHSFMYKALLLSVGTAF